MITAIKVRLIGIRSCPTDRGVTVGLVANVSLVLNVRQKGAAYSVNLMVALCIGVLVEVVVLHQKTSFYLFHY